MLLPTTFSRFLRYQTATVMFCHVNVVCIEGKGLPENLVW